jgi:putative ABC transport system permease protein
MARWFSELLYMIRQLNRRSAERDLNEEICSHLELEANLNAQDGMSAEEARLRALRQFGNVRLAREDTRAVWGFKSVEVLVQDLRFGARMLVRNPGFTVVAILTLALVIGATSAIFSAVNAALLKQLPYKDSERLVLLWGTDRLGNKRGQISFTNMEDWRGQSNSFEEVVAYSGNEKPILAGKGEPEQITAIRVSEGYFQLMQTEPLIGRAFLPEEQQEGRDQVVILSYGLWQRRFGKDPGLVGQTLQLDGKLRLVVGIMPPEFRSLPASLVRRPNEIYMPLAGTYDDTQRSWTWLRAIARLKPGVPIEQAQAELDVIAHNQEVDHPASNAGRGVRVVRLHEDLVRNLKPILLTLQGATVLVVLIACLNLANLLLARLTARTKEIAVREALGAGRRRLLRQMITESLLLSATGGTCGLALAVWGVSILRTLGTKVLPELVGIQVDLSVVVFTGGLSVLTGLLFGIAPALQVSAGNLADSLKEAWRGKGAAVAKSRLRTYLVVSEVALSVVLLSGAGLLIRSFMNLRRISPGFDSRNALVMNVFLPEAKYPLGPSQVAFYRDLFQRIDCLPGVISAGAVSILPESGNFDHTPMKVEGRFYGPGEELIPDLYRITPGYFSAMSIPLLEGRRLSEEDDQDHPPVAVINQTMAESLWPGEDAIGKRIWSGAGNTTRTIVGVVADVYQYGLDSEKTMQLYVPHAENAGRNMTLVIRSSVDPSSVVQSARAQVLAIDKDQPVSEVQTMDEVLAESMASRRFSMNLMALFAGIALAMAAIGIYGVISYSVAERKHEFGVRLALGASRGVVLWLVIRQGMARALAGLGAGLAGSVVLTRLMAGLLFGVNACDFDTLSVAAALLTIVALFACYIPARSATNTDPVNALRCE